MNPRRFAIQILGIAGLLAIFTFGGTSWGLRINTTPSVPVGLWRLQTGGFIQRGRVVSACLTQGIENDQRPLFQMAKDRGYLHAGDCPGGMTPVFKPVAALPGDTVTIDDAGMVVNGQRLPYSLARLTDANNRPIPQLPHGRYTVMPGTVWLVSAKTNSFDSRYFGPIPLKQIQGTMTPLLVGGHP